MKVFFFAHNMWIGWADVCLRRLCTIWERERLTVVLRSMDFVFVPFNLPRYSISCCGFVPCRLLFSSMCFFFFFLPFCLLLDVCRLLIVFLVQCLLYFTYFFFFLTPDTMLLTNAYSVRFPFASSKPFVLLSTSSKRYTIHFGFEEKRRWRAEWQKKRRENGKKTMGKINTMKWICKASCKKGSKQEEELRPTTTTKTEEQTSKARSIRRYGLGHLVLDTT